MPQALEGIPFELAIEKSEKKKPEPSDQQLVQAASTP
eukprot:CAMPEP_0197864084 /NCGR_PEP_ID=MMETSP1438-20131217/42024_1 /TAXON_ID=1461541 /ORGANISM="Pterosperma sp., Strain CCMP1384" /LENGTH=36 /DNA_ID= /DNA_START= /DNA_END= /DNA_ORIENTATION=